MQSHTPSNHTHPHKYFVFLLAHFSLNLAFTHSIVCVYLSNGSNWVFFTLESLNSSYDTTFESVAFVWFEEKRHQQIKLAGCVFFCTGSKRFPSVEIKEKGKCQSFQATHIQPLWSSRLFPYVPCPFFRFVWITLWSTCKCKFKAVSQCPRLIHLIVLALISTVRSF